MPSSPVISRLRELLYPQLARMPVQLRDEALRRARKAPFDLIEWVGVLAGLAVTARLTQYSAESLSALGRVGAALANFSQSVILLTVLVGPFLLRRTRRALRARRGDDHSDSSPM